MPHFLFSVCAIAVSAIGQEAQSPAPEKPVPEWVAIPEDSIPDPKPGMTIEQVEALFKQKDPRPHERKALGEVLDPAFAQIVALHAEHERMLRHSFTTRYEDHELIGMIPITSRLTTLVFSDGKLSRIVKTPPRTGKTIMKEIEGDPMGSAAVWEEDPIDPSQRLELVLNAEPFSPEEFIAFTKEEREEDLNARIRHREPILILPDLKEAMMRRTEADFREHFPRSLELQKKFDPLKVKPMMTREDVEAQYGSSKNQSNESNGVVTRVYGEHLQNYPIAWIAVLFKDGKVQAVWSNDFLNKTLVPEKSN